MFIRGEWLWDTDGVLAAYDEEGHLIDDIARLAVKYSDRVTKEATMRLIANAPEMYTVLAILADNLSYSGLEREARRDVLDFLKRIDFPCYCENSKKLVAYAPEMFELVKQVAVRDDSGVLQSIREKAEELVKVIDEENGDNKNHE